MEAEAAESGAEVPDSVSAFRLFRTAAASRRDQPVRSSGGGRGDGGGEEGVGGGLLALRPDRENLRGFLRREGAQATL